MNFQSAAYLAEMDNITVDYVKVEDDIAVQDSLYTVGRPYHSDSVLALWGQPLTFANVFCVLKHKRKLKK